jgi:excisionase family DNA binding protein
MTGPANSAERDGISAPNTSRVPHSHVVRLQPLALPPRAAAQFLSISKRTLSRLIAAGKIVARKEGSRTLVDVESLRTYYERLPVKR